MRKDSSRHLRPSQAPLISYGDPKINVVELPTMICPECRAEYRQGFHRCADCDVELLDHLPTAPTQSREFDGDLVTIWVGDDQSRCLEQCLWLREAGLRYHVSQELKSRIGTSVIWRYVLGVPADAAVAAKSLLELPDTVVEESSDTTEEDENQALLEYPDGPMTAADQKHPQFLQFLLGSMVSGRCHN
jgi:hypothetical protein